MQASEIAVVKNVVYDFLTSGFMYKYIILILINWWLMNLIFSMTKAMNGQNSSKQNFHPLSTFQCYLVNSASINAYFPFFFLSPFLISNVMNFFWRHSSCDCMAYEIMKYNQFQISENKPDETPYVKL